MRVNPATLARRIEAVVDLNRLSGCRDIDDQVVAGLREIDIKRRNIRHDQCIDLGHGRSRVVQEVIAVT